MLIQFTDFNDADAVIRQYKTQWRELERVLTEMPLHLKASDQAGIQGTPIFDPVGTNAHIKDALTDIGWSAGIPIPNEYKTLGINIDFGKGGVIVEVQFSNYPFLLNNTVRSDLFRRERIKFAGHDTGLLVLVAKAHMFPSSNSTLYYEQAINQLSLLLRNGIFTIPVRLVGLFETTGHVVPVKYTNYGARYSRNVTSRLDYVCEIQAGGRGCCRLTVRPA